MACFEIEIAQERFLAENDALLQKAFRAKNGEAIRKLYNGDLSGYADDHSAAEQALCNFLAFYTQDSQRIDCIVRSSGLYREKWERPKYREDTIRKAIESQPHYYDPQYKSGNASSHNVTSMVGDRQSEAHQQSEQAGERLAERQPASLQNTPTRLLSLSELHQLTCPEWLIEGHLPQDTLGLLYGASGEGKTFVAVDMACSVASGKPWLGWQCQKGPVVIIAAEDSRGLANRICAWKVAHPNERLHDGLYVFPDAVQFSDRADVDHLLIDLEGLQERPALIIVDTMARCLLGQDENSAKDVGLFVEGCDRLRKATGAAVLVVHHTGKQGDIERGSSALRAACDTMMLAKMDKTGVITLSCAKQKNFRAFDKKRLRLVDEITSQSCYLQLCTGAGTSESSDLNEREHQLLESIYAAAGNEGLSLKDIIPLGEIPERSLQRILKKFVDLELLLRDGEGVSTKYFEP